MRCGERLRTCGSCVLFAMLVPLVAGTSACQSTDDAEDLQALLRDADLTSVPSTVAASKGTSGQRTPAFDTGFTAFGQWTFDDCNSFRTNLADQTFNGNTAFRSVGVTCAPGMEGQAVSLAVKEDIVYVPDQPNFTFENGVTVAAWFNPTQVGGTRTLFRKRDK